MNNIILFDGECNFCDHGVQFIIKRDPTGIYKFASLQSTMGLKLLKEHHVPEDVDSFILIEDNKYHEKSSAALRVCKNLTGIWKLFFIFLLIPKPLRDIVYDVIAKNRYKWFGKKNSCMIPSPEIRARFIEETRKVEAPGKG